MREILFKALDKYNDKWVEGFYAFWPENKYYIIQNSCNIDINVTTLCQYTGLKDSLDTKIFEGDLITLIPSSDIIFVIKWNHNDCCFEVESLGSGKSFPLNDLLAKEATVVGNKFDVR